MTAGLIRGTIQLSPRERRKGQKGRAPIFGNDILHSLRVWRPARGNGDSANVQYRLHRSAALGRSFGYALHEAKVERVRATLACREAEARMFAEASKALASIREITTQLRAAA